MPVPLGVKYDRYADIEGFGLISQSAAPAYVTVNGVALVTWWLSNAWGLCQNPVTTSWADCAAGVVTGWTNCITQPSTTWTECEDE